MCETLRYRYEPAHLVIEGQVFLLDSQEMEWLMTGHEDAPRNHVLWRWAVQQLQNKIAELEAKKCPA